MTINRSRSGSNSSPPARLPIPTLLSERTTDSTTAPRGDTNVFAKKLKWSTVTGSMKVARSGCSAVALDDERILVLGGSSGYWSFHDTMEIFHVPTQSWTTVPLQQQQQHQEQQEEEFRMIHPRSRFAAVRLLPNNKSNDDSSDEKVIVMGGLNNSGVLAQCEMLNMTTQETVELSPMNVCRYGCAAVALSATEIMVIGGQDDGTHGHLDTAEVYNVETNQWTLLPGTLSTPRSMCAAVRIEDRVYVMGGTSRWEILNSCEVLELTHHLRSTTSSNSTMSAEGYQWMPGPDMRYPRQGLTAVVWDNQTVVAIGAPDYMTFLLVNNHPKRTSAGTPAAELLHIATGTWTLIDAKMSVDRYQAAAVTMGDQIYVMGGESTLSRHRTMERMAFEFLPDIPVLPSRNPTWLSKTKNSNNNNTTSSSSSIGSTVELEDWIKDVTTKKNMFLCQLQEAHSKVSEEHASIEEALQCKIWEQEQKLDQAIMKHHERIAVIQRELDRHRALHEEALVRIESAKESWLAKIDRDLDEAKEMAKMLGGPESRIENTVDHEDGKISAIRDLDELLCPITGQIMVDPVLAMDGFSYEREAIEKFFAGQEPYGLCSPVTGEELTSDTLIPNFALREQRRKNMLANVVEPDHDEPGGDESDVNGPDTNSSLQTPLLDTQQGDQDEQDPACHIS